MSIFLLHGLDWEFFKESGRMSSTGELSKSERIVLIDVTNYSVLHFPRFIVHHHTFQMTITCSKTFPLSSSSPIINVLHKPPHAVTMHCTSSNAHQMHKYIITRCSLPNIPCREGCSGQWLRCSPATNRAPAFIQTSPLQGKASAIPAKCNLHARSAHSLTHSSVSGAS